MTGKVVRVVPAKNFGFIKGDDGEDYFFHTSALKNCKLVDMHAGREVTFEESEGEKGPRAEDIHI